MNRTGGWLKHWMQDLIGAGLAVAVGLGALAARPFGLWLEQLSYDLPYCLRPDQAADGVVIVSMESTSQSALSQVDANGWDRQLHGDLLSRLLARGARLVAFTTIFSEPAATNSMDRLFAQALRRARGRVVLAGISAPHSTSPEVRAPIRELAAEAPWGLLTSPSESHDIIRRHDMASSPPTFAARIAQLLGKTSTNSFSSRWWKYYAPQLQLPEVSYDQVLRNVEPAGFFKGKVVLVNAAPVETNRFSTPYTRWTGQRATRNEIEATAILNLSRGEWLWRSPQKIESGILVLAGALFGFGFMGMRRTAAALLAVGAVALVSTCAYLLFAYLQGWFPWLIIAGVQIPTALAWAWLCETADRPRIPRPRPQPIPFPATPALPSTPTPAVAPSSHPTAQPRTATSLPNIPDHSLIKCIGRGAYGEVWLARDIIGRYDAVKIVKSKNFPHVTPYDREFKGIERFAPISRTHPGLVQVLHVGRHDAVGYFFYIMELADDAGPEVADSTPSPEKGRGILKRNTATPINAETYSPRTLASELTRRGHFNVKESIQIGLALSSALQHLHEHQLVHRDIKPSNIIFVDGAPKFADIGLVAQLGSGKDEVTRLGTEGYLAPEGPGAPTADVYGLGKVLYEISMGRDRWQFPEFPTTLGTRSDQDALRRLHEIILTACETDPSHRFQTAAEMQSALEVLRGTHTE